MTSTLKTNSSSLVKQKVAASQNLKKSLKNCKNKILILRISTKSKNAPKGVFLVAEVPGINVDYLARLRR